jgi:lipooligosaccharide transport system permease protein
MSSPVAAGTGRAARGRRRLVPIVRVVEHHLMVYRRTWRGTVFSTVLSPILFLAAIGVGLGSFIDQANPTGVDGVPYLIFLAPGLLAGQAMNTGTFESTYPVMAGIRWLKTYVAMIIAPLSPWHVAFGQLTWVALRLTFGSTVFLAVMVAFGATDVPHAIGMLPVAVLTGLAFAAPIQAFSATRKNDNAFAALFRFVITPMFIFSGTFFPITQLPDLIEWIAYVTPLWHGVALSRAIATDAVDPVLVAVNLLVLTSFIVVGLAASVRTFTRKLAE